MIAQKNIHMMIPNKQRDRKFNFIIESVWDLNLDFLTIYLIGTIKLKVISIFSNSRCYYSIQIKVK